MNRPDTLPDDAWQVWLSFYGDRRGAEEGPFGAVYPRVSSPDQEEGWSLISQLKAELKRADDDGVYILPEHIYWEVHTAEELWERVALTRLRADFRSGAFQVVYFYAVDRFSREPFYMDLVLDEAKRAGVEARFVMQHFDDTAEGQLLRSVAGYVAKKELYAIKERTNRGKRERVVENGKPYGSGKPPYGYAWKAPLTDSKRDKNCFCEPDPLTAPIVKRIFAEVAAGTGLRQICAGLMRDGIPTPGRSRRWQSGTVSSILRNDAYVGRSYGNRWKVIKGGGVTRSGKPKRKTVARPREEWVLLKDGVYPPLVTEMVWDAAQTVRATNKALAARNNKTPEGFLLRGGFARCAECGGNLVARTYPKSGYRIYMCSGHFKDIHYPGGPTRVSANSADLDAAVWAHVKRLMNEEGYLDAELQRLAATDHVGLDLKAVEARIADIDAQLANYTLSLATAAPTIVALITTKMNELAEQRASLETERGHVQRRGVAVTRARDHVEQLKLRLGPQLAQALDDMPFQQRRQTLLALGVRVTVANRNQPGKWGLPPHKIEASLPIDVDSAKSDLWLLALSTSGKFVRVVWEFAGAA